MSLRLALYSRLPIWAQNLVLSRVAAKSARWRLGGQFEQDLSQSLEREHWEPELVELYRRAKLKAYLELAYERSPYYRGLFDERGITPRLDDPDEALRSLPIMTRDLIRQHYEQLKNPSEAGRAIRAQTSGTTGSGLIFPVSHESVYATWATWWRYRLSHGIHLTTPAAMFHGSAVLTPASQKQPPFWRRIKNKWEDQWFYSIFHLGPETAQSYVDHLRSTGVAWLDGHPSILSLLASYIIEQKLDPGDNVQIVTLGSENVLPSQVETIRKAFGAEVRQHYGLAEGVANFSECEFGRLHVDEDYSTVEFGHLDGQAHRVIGTGVNNASFFFIRYDTGDVVREGQQGCECGRSGRIIESIDGRREDYVVLPNGTMVGRLDQVFYNMVNIREAQLVQDARDRLKVMIVPLTGYGPDNERQLLKEFRLRIGDEIKLDLRYVKSIPRTENGKLRFVVSSVDVGPTTVCTANK